jgi:hypothetical protein
MTAARWWPGFALEPPTKMPDTRKAATKRATVIAFNRFGVTQEKCFAAMKDLIPAALPVAPIAVIMHCMHTVPEAYRPVGSRRAGGRRRGRERDLGLVSGSAEALRGPASA